MAKTRGEKVMEKEQKRLQRERKRQIEAANKMLIPVPKSTTTSLELLSFDPSGALRFANNRWLKLYRIKEVKDLDELIKIFEHLHSEVRFTKRMDNKKSEIFMTLRVDGEIYDEVRTKLAEDEALIKRHIDFFPLDVNESMMSIYENQSHFSYASMVRGKKDWRKECVPSCMENNRAFRMGEAYGESCFIMQYPEEMTGKLIQVLRELGCLIVIAIDLKGIDAMDQIDFRRTLELKYNQRMGNRKDCDFINLSYQIVFCCDSDDAREIIEKTVFSVFTHAGFVMSECIGAQKVTAESVLSNGIISKKCMQNVKMEVVEQILREEELWQ